MEKNQEKTKMDTILAERMAAHQLMTQFVKDNASEVAHVISELVPFICGEADLSSLKSDLNTVNITFATVALYVTKTLGMEYLYVFQPMLWKCRTHFMNSHVSLRCLLRWLISLSKTRICQHSR